MSSIFTKIINRELPAYIIAEDSRYIAFLDVTPVKRGHTLVVPKVEVDNIFDLDDETIGDLMVFTKKVANRIKSKIPCKKVAIVGIGLEVPHAHIHLIPIDREGDLDFQNRISLSKEQMIKTHTTLQM